MQNVSPCFISLILPYSHLLYNSVQQLQHSLIYKSLQCLAITSKSSYFVQFKPNFHAIWNFQASGNTLFYKEKITIYLNCKICVFTEWLFLLFRFHSNYIGSYFWKTGLLFLKK